MNEHSGGKIVDVFYACCLLVVWVFGTFHDCRKLI